VLALPLGGAAVRSVEDALEALTAPEALADYRPREGAPAGAATRTERLLALPRLLVLHVMRFEYSGRAAKLNKPLAFAPRLALRPGWLAPEARAGGAAAREFDLVATVSHHGKGSGSGHYTADARQRDGGWLRFDDGDVARVPLRAVLAERPYLLFYQRA
jgi:ubiquitin carboxyl-terminal hydrolase 10